MRKNFPETRPKFSLINTKKLKKFLSKISRKFRRISLIVFSQDGGGRGFDKFRLSSIHGGVILFNLHYGTMSDYEIKKHKWGRNWRVEDPDGDLVCVTVYKKGAKEVVNRLKSHDDYLKQRDKAIAQEQKEVSHEYTRKSVT